MPHKNLAVDQVLGVLRETPRRLTAVKAAATPAQLRTAPEPGAWSATEVLAHLRSCADMWGGAIETIVAVNHPTVRAINPLTWIESTDYRELAFATSLKAYLRQRAQLTSVLGSLSPKGWLRSAHVIGAGKPLERTVHDYADRLARHERAHWEQLEMTTHAVVR